MLMPPQQNSSMGAALASQLGSMGGMAALAGGSLGLKNPNDMFVAMLKSRTVEDAMVQHFGLMQEYHARYLSDARKASRVMRPWTAAARIT
jgi:tyrosine-protein kinase Etk/Wzc